MAPAKLERLKTIAERTWLRTLDDRIGISSQERAPRKAAHAGAGACRRRSICSPTSRSTSSTATAAIAMPADNPWGFKLKVPRAPTTTAASSTTSPSARGTLNEEERYKINDHIVQTIIMLSQPAVPEAPASGAGDRRAATTRRWTAPAIRAASARAR